MADLPFHMTAPPEVYRKRREKLASTLHRPLMIPAGKARARNYPTNTHPFRAGSSYLYFGGPPLSGAAWIIEPGSDGDQGCLLVRATFDFDDAVWTGKLPGDTDIAQTAGVSVGSLVSPDEIPLRIADREVAFVALPCPATLAWVASFGLHPADPQELEAIIALRLVKDQYQLAAMRVAAEVSVQAHRAAMRVARSGRHEADVAAAYGAVLTANHCQPSFTPIATVRAEVLHSEGYHHTLEKGRLLVVDAGAEEPGGYACDITRTLPIGGEFSSIQGQLYNTVLRAERTSIAACVPGKRFRDIHDLAARIICEGLVEAELLRGDPAELAARGAHTLFFVHGLGHLIGLDVHDMEDFGDLAGYAPGRTRRPEFGNKFLRLDRDLQPGMTVTIEPGFYLVPGIWQQEALIAPFRDTVNQRAVDALLKQPFGGMRIEDTICVRDAEADGPEVLSAALPTDAEAMTTLALED